MNNKGYIRSFAAIFTVFTALWGFANLSSLREVAERIIGILSPILIGVCIAFVLNIPLRRIERLMISRIRHINKRLCRALSISFCLLISIGIAALLAGLVIPQVFKTAEGIFGSLPRYIDRLNGWYGVLSDFMRKFSVELPDFNSESIMGAISQFMSENSQSIVGTSLNVVTRAFGMALDCVFAIVIAVYILSQKERLRATATRLLYSIFSEKQTEMILGLAELTENRFSAFVSGQLTEAVILGSLCFVGMLLFSIPYAPIVSLLIGVTALIPIFGGIAGAAVGAFLIFLESPVKALIFVIFIIALQQLEGNIIYPKVVGARVGLPGLWVLVSVSVGAEFGIIGMLIAVPLASILYTLASQLTNARLKEKGLCQDEREQK